MPFLDQLCYNLPNGVHQLTKQSSVVENWSNIYIMVNINIYLSQLWQSYLLIFFRLEQLGDEQASQVNYCLHTDILSQILHMPIFFQDGRVKQCMNKFKLSSISCICVRIAEVPRTVLFSLQCYFFLGLCLFFTCSGYILMTHYIFLKC